MKFHLCVAAQFREHEMCTENKVGRKCRLSIRSVANYLIFFLFFIFVVVLAGICRFHFWHRDSLQLCVTPETQLLMLAFLFRFLSVHSVVVCIRIRFTFFLCFVSFGFCCVFYRKIPVGEVDKRQRTKQRRIVWLCQPIFFFGRQKFSNECETPKKPKSKNWDFFSAFCLSTNDDKLNCWIYVYRILLFNRSFHFPLLGHSDILGASANFSPIVFLFCLFCAKLQSICVDCIDLGC